MFLNSKLAVIPICNPLNAWWITLYHFILISLLLQGISHSWSCIWNLCKRKRGIFSLCIFYTSSFTLKPYIFCMQIIHLTFLQSPLIIPYSVLKTKSNYSESGDRKWWAVSHAWWTPPATISFGDERTGGWHESISLELWGLWNDPGLISKENLSACFPSLSKQPRKN